MLPDRPTASVEARLDACLDLIATEDHRWNAMLALNPRARMAAREADAARGRRTPAGSLHGMVLAIKDNIDISGMATSSGCLALEAAMPLTNATVIDRLIAAGAIIVGKTNLSEFSFEVRSRSSLGGDVLSPFFPATTAGGSSGGSGVAVARGFATAAIGTDTGGSVRVPAACNGLVGLRPAHGILPLDGVAPLAPSTDTIGPIARTVEDARRIYLAMGGRIAGGESREPPRIGVLRAAFGTDPRVIAACERALRKLADGGAEIVDPFVIPDIAQLLAGPHIVDVEFAAAFGAYLARNFVTGTAPQSLAALLEGGRFLPEYRPVILNRLSRDVEEARAVLAAHRRLTDTLVRAMAERRLDGLFHPTLRVIPEGLGNPSVGWAPELAPRTGWPAISVPAGAQSCPVGVELLAPTGREQMLFDLARIIEQA